MDRRSERWSEEENFTPIMVFFSSKGLFAVSPSVVTRSKLKKLLTLSFIYHLIIGAALPLCLCLPTTEDTTAIDGAATPGIASHI